MTLVESASELDEVVVIGYGTTTVNDATGSVASITAEDFNQGAIVSSDQLLTGKVAGVVITNSGGAPDAAPNIRIRGGASLSANNSPLIVIDGIPLDVVNPAGVNNPLSLINPNDIASFSILKDASATAIYGARASNGIILITTKKGTLGETKYNLNVSTSINKVGDKIDDNTGSNFKSSFTVDSSLSLDTIANDNPVLIFPNKIYFQKPGVFEIVVFNMLGSQIRRIYSNFNKDQVLHLDLQRGIYLINVKESKHSKAYKMPVY